MAELFRNCSSLTSLDLSGWNTSKVTNMAMMFEQCSKLETIYVSNLWNTENVEDKESRMFNECYNLAGAIGYYRTLDNVTYANYTTGYLTDINGSTPTNFTFKLNTYDGTFTFNAEAGMTWNEWLSSEYNSFDVDPYLSANKKSDSTIVFWSFEYGYILELPAADLDRPIGAITYYAYEIEYV